jgi:hypothetical protein
MKGKSEETWVMRQKRLSVFQEVNGKRFDNGMFVDLTIYDVAAGLIRELGENVAHSRYPSRANEAIKDLLREAITERESKCNDANVFAT